MIVKSDKISAMRFNNYSTILYYSTFVIYNLYQQISTNNRFVTNLSRKNIQKHIIGGYTINFEERKTIIDNQKSIDH